MTEKDYETKGIELFTEWLKEVNPVYTVTPMPDKHHYDCIITSTDGKYKWKVELKTMTDKDYFSYNYVIINKFKTLEYKGEAPADLFWILYKDGYVVTFTRKQAEQYPTVEHQQLYRQTDPTLGYTIQKQYQIPHTDEGKGYHLYYKHNRIK